MKSSEKEVEQDQEFVVHAACGGTYSKASVSEGQLRTSVHWLILDYVQNHFTLFRRMTEQIVEQLTFRPFHINIKHRGDGAESERASSKTAAFSFYSRD